MDINKLFATNVKYVIKQRKLKIGDIERELGVSLGYFSRSRHDNNGSISLAIAYKIAQILELPIDVLCSEDIKEEKITEVTEC